MGWLLNKVANRVEKKVPGAADAVETMKSDATTGESHAFVVTPDGYLTQVKSEPASQEDLADQLSRLGAVHDRGALSERQRHLTVADSRCGKPRVLSRSSASTSPAADIGSVRDYGASSAHR
jgi:hypothetical protein